MFVQFVSHVGATAPSQREHSLLWSTSGGYRALDRCSNRESITVTCIIALVIRKEVHSSPAFEEVIEDEWEVPIQEPAAEEDVPAAPEAIPDATRHSVLQRCMTLENLETP